MLTIIPLPITDARPACGPFPYCRLHGRSIIGELPKRCPLRGASPVAALWEMRKLAWKGIGQFDRDGDKLDDGLDMQDRAEVCHDCIGRNLSNRRIQRLRRGLAVRR